VVIGDRGLKEGSVEYQGRRDAQAHSVPLRGIMDWLGAKLSA
jgi:prolyl-tRNA synthetase